VLDVIVPLRALRTAVVHQEQLAQMDRVQNAFLKDFVGRVGRLSALEVARAESLRSRLWARVRTFFETYNILVLPATQMAGFSKDDDRPTRLGGRPVQDAVHTTLSTYAISATGLPAISIPCGYTPEGLPIGLQIVGRWRREADVLRAAAAFEDVFPWSDRRPPLVTTALAVAPKDA
jgi:amidase